MRIPLTGGYYIAKNLIANAQRCLNIYPEKNPGESQPSIQVTDCLAPGLTLLASSPISATNRGLYRASNGNLYTVIGNNLYYVSPSWVFSLLGTLSSGGNNPVGMVDNGLVLLIVDGSSNGYTVELATGVFAPVVGGQTFYGSIRADFLSNFFLVSDLNTNILRNNIQIDTLANGIPVWSDSFNPNGGFVQKIAWADKISSFIVMHNEVWLIGTLTTEVWYNAGGLPSPFQKIPNVFIEHGCIAPYSIAKQDLNVYWLSQDLQGQAVVIKGNNYQATRISTHAIENEISQYSVINDAIGFTYQQEGHTFYVLIFPTADKTWVFDEASGLWHERSWMDNNGGLHRIRANSCANAYGHIVVGDWQNGNLYALDLANYTDNGQPIPRIRTYPHLISNGNRINYKSFIADMAVGQDTTGTTSSNPPMASLRWSDDRGVTYNNKIEQSIGAEGQYLKQPKWWRLGLARDRIFELSWSTNNNTALQGAWIETEEAET